MSRVADGTDDSDDAMLAELSQVAAQMASKKVNQFRLQLHEAEAYVQIMKCDRFFGRIGSVIYDGYESRTNHIIVGDVDVCITSLDLRGLGGNDQTTEPPALLMDTEGCGRRPIWWMQPSQVLLVWVENEQHITLTAFTRGADGTLHAVRSESDAHPAVDTRQVRAVLQLADSDYSPAEVVAALGDVLAATLRAVLPYVPSTVTQAMMVLCPALYSCPLQLVRMDNGQRLMDRFELVFCPSIVFLELLADRFNSQIPPRTSPGAPSVTIGHSIEYEDSGPLHHLSAEMACVEHRVRLAAGGLTV
jgi:hypothetical protein